MQQLLGTTILCVRRGNVVAMAGDGQVTLGNIVMKGTARANTWVLGLTKTDSRVAIALAGPMLQDPASGYECVAPQITVSLTYAPVVIYIGREFAPGTCAYDEILAHELRHMKTYMEHLPRVEKTVRAALANLDRAGLLPAVTLSTGDLLERAAPAERGILIANPPYGERLSELDELAAFYTQLGAALKRNFAGWNCYLLTADLRLPKLMRLTPSKKTPLYNGAIECRLFEFKMVAGSNRNADRPR